MKGRKEKDEMNSFEEYYHSVFGERKKKGEKILTKDLDDFFLTRTFISEINFWIWASYSNLIPFTYIERTWLIPTFHWNQTCLCFRDNLTIFDKEFILSTLSPFDTYCNIIIRKRLDAKKIQGREELAIQRNAKLKAELEWLPKGNLSKMPEFQGIEYEKWHEEAEKLIDELIN